MTICINTKFSRVPTGFIVDFYNINDSYAEYTQSMAPYRTKFEVEDHQIRPRIDETLPLIDTV